MSSDTKSDINDIKYLDKFGNQIDTKTEIKRQTTDTDYHFGLLANQEKIFSIKSENLSDLDNIINTSESRNSNDSKSSDTSKNSNDSKSSITSKKSSYSSKPRINNISLNSPSYKNYSNETKLSTPEIKSSIPYNNVPVNNNYIPVNNNYIPVNNNYIPNIENNTTYSTNLSPQETRMKKIELLRRLSEIKSKGYSLTKEYDFNSSIDEMEYEYALLRSFADKRNGVKLYKNILLNGISLMEFLNDKYDPFDFKLKGWSEHMSVEVDSFEDIFEELYEKYKGTGKSTPVEIRLILLLLASGAAFHFSKTQLGSIPGVSSVATGFVNKMMSEKKTSQFMSPQEINLEKQKESLREHEKQVKQEKKNNLIKTISKHSSMSRDAPDVRAPENVQEILSRIKNIQQNSTSLNNTTETQEESTINDRLVSDSTFSENNKKKGKKKPMISINTY